jgi:hypothetical protein
LHSNDAKLLKLKLKKLIIALQFLLIIAIPLYSQTGKAGKAIKKEKKVEKTVQIDYEKNRKEALTHRYKIQTPEVQKRMKNSRKKVDQYHKQKNKTTFKDIFNRLKRKR